MQIPILNEEYWWGGIVDFGWEMPYHMLTERTLHVGLEGQDQSASLFLSNQGRFLYSKNPFSITFSKGVITLQGDGPFEFRDDFRTLKEAHTAAAKAYFQKNQDTPDECFFKMPQYNTWIEMMYNQNQAQILAYAQAIIADGLKPGILMIDEGWSEDYGVYDFYPGRFPDPHSMMDQLHKMGFHVMLWVTPYISPDSNAFRHLRETDYLLKDENGEFAIRPWWNGFSCVLDLTNPGACAWFRQKLAWLQKRYGVDGFKFDGGDAEMYRASDQAFIPSQPQDQVSTFNRFAADYPFNELRSVWNMSGTSLVCRLHDKLHSWTDDGLNCIIPNTILQGLLGYYFGCPDMVGGGNYISFVADDFAIDQELYMRWLQTSLLCPMLQFSISPKRVLSPQRYQQLISLLALRDKYVPYILQLARQAAITAEPIVRHLEYEFPNQGYATDNTMFMLGDRYLVVPMLKKGASERTVLLPAGKWKTDTGSYIDGQQPVSLQYDESALYVLERME